MQRMKEVERELRDKASSGVLTPSFSSTLLEAAEIISRYRLSIAMMQQPRVPINGTRGGTD